MLRIGSLIEGKYRVERLIGEGGMSYIYLARNVRSNHCWVIKEAKVGIEGVKQSLVAEADIMKNLSHPNLPQIIDIVENRDTFLIVMEYVEGISLKEYLNRYGAPKQSTVIEWAKQLCDVLLYLHSQQPPIIYRDLKPSNIMLRPDGSLALLDFGTARKYKEENREDTILLGTCGYAAPEQYGTMGQSDERTDIYTLGATLFHLATGYHPSDVPMEFPMIRKINPRLSEKFEAIISKCTQTNSNSRYQNCAEVLKDLEKLTIGAQHGHWKLAGFLIGVACTVGFLALVIFFGGENMVVDLLALLSFVLMLVMLFQLGRYYFGKKEPVVMEVPVKNPRYIAEQSESASLCELQIEEKILLVHTEELIH